MSNSHISLSSIKIGLDLKEANALTNAAVAATVGLALKEANALTNAAVAATKSTSKRLASNLDDLVPPLGGAAVIADGMSVPFGSFADDAAWAALPDNPNAFFSVVDDLGTRTKSSHVYQSTAHVTTQSKTLTKIGSNAGDGLKHHVEIDASLLSREINLPSDLNSPKLRSKFESHKEHFGMKDVNFNKQNAELFKQRVADHVAHPDTVAIAGTYRTTEKVVHYFNPKTEVNVMKDINGKFLSGWKLGEDQLLNIRINGNIQ